MRRIALVCALLAAISQTCAEAAAVLRPKQMPSNIWSENSLPRSTIMSRQSDRFYLLVLGRRFIFSFGVVAVMIAHGNEWPISRHSSNLTAVGGMMSLGGGKARFVRNEAATKKKGGHTVAARP